MKKKLIIMAGLMLMFVILLACLNALLEPLAHVPPAYEKENLSEVFQGAVDADTGITEVSNAGTSSAAISGTEKRGHPFSEEEYQDIFFQTGLGRSAVDALLERGQDQFEAGILQAQKDFFAEPSVDCERIGIITREEKLVQSNGRLKPGFRFVSLQDGDILLTRATHSIGWRHGHAAIVVDEKKGTTLEAVLLGVDSDYQSAEKWREYPNVIQLRLKEGRDGKTVEELGKEIASYAKKQMYGLPYGLLAGFPDKEKGTADMLKTQCSHLVWYPYYKFGFDIDSDGSWLVTPENIAGSEYLEVVQVYGMNPEELWGQEDKPISSME